MSAPDAAWRGVAAFVFAVCGGALWLGGAGSLQAAQRIEAASVGRGTPGPYVCSFRRQTGQPCLGCGGTAAFGAASLRQMLQDFAPVPGLLFAAALINTLVSTLLNPLREDRVSERFPHIVQDALFVGFFFATATFIFRESWTASAVSAVVVGFCGVLAGGR